MNTNAKSEFFDAIVIGAGFSGLYQLHRLRDDLCLNAIILEQGEGVGGTWYWNRYPGARCDSESHGYAYFFSRALHESWQWSERYPGHTEIRQYLNHVADRLELKKDIFFSSLVSKCTFQVDENLWHVQVKDGQVYKAKWLVTAVGCLSSANIPDISGLSSFSGDWYHTGRWPHEAVDFKDKKVGQIGTGSTGIQIAPIIADTAAHLTIFQRTANYSVPARNAAWDKSYSDWVREHYLDLKALVQSTPNGHPFRISSNLAMEVSDAERNEMFERAWEKGGLRFRSVFHDLLNSSQANNTAAEFIKSKIRKIVKNPETAHTLSDIDHPYAAKRPPIDTNYFETFNKQSVTLVDLKVDPISEIIPSGVLLKSGAEHKLDALVFATGFDAMTGPLLNLDITGRTEPLTDYWRAGPLSYLGLAIPNFPNMFTITGPGSPSVLTNMPVSIEQHVDWITDCINFCMQNGVDTIEAEVGAAEGWVAHVREAADVTLLPEAKNSWYWGANIPGKPRVFMPYAGGLVRYREICESAARDGYTGFSFLQRGHKKIMSKLDYQQWLYDGLGV